MIQGIIPAKGMDMVYTGEATESQKKVQTYKSRDEL